MNWIKNFVRPKLKSLIQSKKTKNNHLWNKCKNCDEMLFYRDLEKKLYVCRHCEYHNRIDPIKRLKILFDNSSFTKIKIPNVSNDPLEFKDKKKYIDRIKEAQKRTEEKDALLVAKGFIGGYLTTVAVFNFFFMGGSMGMAVGEGIITAANHALINKTPLIIVPSSGGARMQEGILSLMQMPRTIIAIQQIKKASLPYIVILTDPTTGGVSASFAMLGDITIAEPKSMIGFAGTRVIKETIQENIPKGFQSSEYLLEHGMIDIIIHRSKLKSKIFQIIDLLMNKNINT